MLRNNKDSRYYRRSGVGFWRCLSVLVAVILLARGLGAYGQVQETSGVVQLGNTLQYGTTSYSVMCSFPSTADVGTNLTITFTLHVNSFHGLVEYVTNYRILAGVFIGSQHLQGLSSSTQNSSFLYPGSTWGPNNITIPLTANNTGLARGQSANATVSITLQDGIYYGGQLIVYTTEPAMQGVAGGLVIQNTAATSSSTSTISSTSQAYVPYAILAAAGAVMMVGAALWPRSPRSTPIPKS
jgi:hypothetical protein